MGLDGMCGASSGAIDVDGAGQRGDPADDRPEFHLPLGYKNAGNRGAEYKDVQIAEMIGNQQST